MSIDLLILYLSTLVVIVAGIITRKELKRAIPVGLFASYYANLWCYVANYFHWWEFPIRILPGIRDISFAVNTIIIPILVMVWVIYSPMSRIKWAFLWTSILTLLEYLAMRNTDLIVYYNGYNWYHSYILWLFSWYIWYSFHKWFYNNNNPHT